MASAAAASIPFPRIHPSIRYPSWQHKAAAVVSSPRPSPFSVCLLPLPPFFRSIGHCVCYATIPSKDCSKHIVSIIRIHLWPTVLLARSQPLVHHMATHNTYEWGDCTALAAAYSATCLFIFVYSFSLARHNPGIPTRFLRCVHM